ncbi:MULTISPECIES: TetR/AcrR family transcriptional regulator [Microbacterium]|uniref:TetR/AcrR family transcriptional regulator n=1 Tax=Microbacterium TaxID=33882 RepID=UPI002783D92B|nr:MULTISPECIES: TetR/AcrR family transcriptional regulator [Microbacterium]MDQ1084566.1 AcrR family transcriptional regulator [Microbacterium sp. SORGH_AS_0344]MDQ1170156.1 AcrR family transcriptional regulator [Microbacterium proteolyticum]
MSSPGWGAPGRNSRQPADETRELALSTALSMLSQTGLTVSLEHLSIEDLIRTAGLPRSTFYRLWPAKERFFADLLVELATSSDSNDAMFYPGTQVAAYEVIEANKHLLATHEGRVAVLRDAVRVAGRMNFEHFSEAVGWRTHVTLVASASSLADVENRERLVAALQETEQLFIERTAKFYGDALSGLGFSFTPGASAELLAGLGAAVVEGLAQRRLVNPELADTIIMKPGIDGQLVEWHPAALGFWGILEALVDLEPHEG